MARTTAGSVIWRCPPFVVLVCAASLACEATQRLTPRSPPDDARMTRDSGSEEASQLPDVRVTLHAPASARVRDTLQFEVLVENSGTESSTLYLRGREPTAEIQLERDGIRVWSSLDGEVIPAVVMVRTLAPRERFTLRIAWHAGSARTPLATGDYTLQALLLTDGIPLRSPPVPMRIVGP